MKYYKYKEQNLNDDDICDVLYGSQTTFSKCVGYCEMKGKYLTTKQLKNKQCLGKNCKFLYKIYNRPFWKHRENIKNLKKQKKVL